MANDLSPNSEHYFIKNLKVWYAPDSSAKPYVMARVTDRLAIAYEPSEMIIETFGTLASVTAKAGRYEKEYEIIDRALQMEPRKVKIIEIPANNKTLAIFSRVLGTTDRDHQGLIAEAIALASSP